MLWFSFSKPLFGRDVLSNAFFVGSAAEWLPVDPQHPPPGCRSPAARSAWRSGVRSWSCGPQAPGAVRSSSLAYCFWRSFLTWPCFLSILKKIEPFFFVEKCKNTACIHDKTRTNLKGNTSKRTPLLDIWSKTNRFLPRGSRNEKDRDAQHTGCRRAHLAQTKLLIVFFGGERVAGLARSLSY